MADDIIPDDKQQLDDVIPTREDGDIMVTDFGKILDEATKKSGLDINKLNEASDGLAKIRDEEPAKDETPKEDAGDENGEAKGEDGKADKDAGAKEGADKDENADKAKDDEAAKKAEEDKAAADKAAAEEAAKKEGEDKKTGRDDDLKESESKLDPHTKPKTKQIIEDFKQKAIKSRDEAESVRKEAEALRKELEEAKKYPAKLPKEVEEELTALRDQVRSLDASRDPAIVNKYDKRIATNADNILAILENQGLPKTVTADLKKKGLTLANLKQYIDTIETGKGLDGKQYDADPDTAESIREAIRENARLAKEKDVEIAGIKTSYEERSKKEVEEQKRMSEEATKRRDKEIEEFVGKYDFLKTPAEVKATDTPAIRKEKEKAITAHNELILKFSEAAKKEMADPVSTSIAAQKGVLAREIVIPELQRKIDAQAKIIAEFTEKAEKQKKAASISKSVASTPRKEDTKEDRGYNNEGFEDIVEDMAKKAGVK